MLRAYASSIESRFNEPINILPNPSNPMCVKKCVTEPLDFAGHDGFGQYSILPLGSNTVLSIWHAVGIAMTGSPSRSLLSTCDINGMTELDFMTYTLDPTTISF